LYSFGAPYLHEGNCTIVNFIEGIFEFAEEDGVSAAELAFYIWENVGKVTNYVEGSIHSVFYRNRRIIFDYDSMGKSIFILRLDKLLFVVMKKGIVE
jgi:hypothetical protein